jgi:hypothetical protein
LHLGPERRFELARREQDGGNALVDLGAPQRIHISADGLGFGPPDQLQQIVRKHLVQLAPRPEDER